MQPNVEVMCSQKFYDSQPEVPTTFEFVCLQFITWYTALAKIMEHQWKIEIIIQVAPSPTPWCCSYRKGSLRVTLDYGRQLYFIYLKVKNSEVNINNNNQYVVCPSFCLNNSFYWFLYIID